MNQSIEDELILAIAKYLDRLERKRQRNEDQN